MSRVPPIPTTRVSTLFISQRLSQQVTNGQLDLFRIQNQVSTGQRLLLPSDDPTATVRSLTNQRLLERGAQLQSNLRGSDSFLAAADAALAEVATLINGVRAEAVAVTNTTASDEQRQAAIEVIDRALQTLVSTGNTSFQGRYLFSGSRSLSEPFQYLGEYVEYRGNETTFRSHADLGFLIETNISGSDVFGGISSEVQGSVDLNPHVSPDTLLRSINRGQGISPNGALSLTVTYAASLAETVTVDLSGAATLGDVARRIESAAPATAGIVVEVAGNGLRISTDSPAVLNVHVGEVSDGVTASELGILTSPNATQTTINGLDLDPVLQPTTRLSDLLGAKSQGRIISPGVNNDIVLTASSNGAQWNGATVEFVAGTTLGNEVATYDGNTNTLTVQIESGVSTARQVAEAINAEGTFTATVDFRDATSAASAGGGTVDATNFGVVTDSTGSGTTLDLAAGLTVSNGDNTATIDLSQAVTVQDLLNAFDGAGASITASINAAGNGINVRSRLSGADFTIGENGGTTAEQLGLRTYLGSSRLADFNHGIGVVTESQRSFTIELDDGLGGITSHTIQLASLDGNGGLVIEVETLDQLMAEIAAATGGDVVASFAPVGNGLVLTDTTGAASMTVRGPVAQRLGFFDESAQPPEATSTTGTLVAEDRHPRQVDSVFNTLIRLRQAIQANDVESIGPVVDQLNQDLDRVTFARAELGARQQALEVLQVRLDDDELQLRAALAQDLEVDLAEAISNLTARQFALQASLQTSASLLNLSVLNFL